MVFALPPTAAAIGRNIYTHAFGESMTGVPATPNMHFRNGALAFTYMSTLLLEFVDEKKSHAPNEAFEILSATAQREPRHAQGLGANAYAKVVNRG